MRPPSRRRFFGAAAQFGAAAALPSLPAAAAGNEEARTAAVGGRVPLDGTWKFRFDPGRAGDAQAWYQPVASADGWSDVTVLQSSRVRVDVLRPTGFSAYTVEWNPRNGGAG